MVIKSRFEADELVQEDRVHYRVYTDQDVFDMEMDKIFSRSWVYVGHESEVAQGGDYKTTHMGKRPVILTRNPDDGQVYVLFNRCRHRGATVCQFETGNSSYFRCAYHGWTYNNTGKLVGVPYRQGYGPDFAPGDLGLVPVARTESYQGFIFASMNPDVPNLSDYLAGAKEYIDAWVSQSPTGKIMLKGGVTKYSYEANWKFQMENSVDGYHFDFVHQSWADLFHQRTGNYFKADERLKGKDLGNGHAIILLDTGQPMVGPGFTMAVFPNLAFLWSHIRHIQPVTLNHTEVGLYHAVPEQVADEVEVKRIAEQNDFYGPVGNAGPDDWECFERCQAGLSSGAAEWVFFNRGWREGMDPANDRIGGPARDDECMQRAIFRQWRRLMSADI